MNATTETTTAAATPGAPVTPQAAKTTRKATAKKAAPKANRNAKAAKPAAKKAATKKSVAKKAAKVTPPREFSKKAIVLDLLRRKGGATMAEIQKATDWQAHSVRGFISGALGKKMGLKVDSTRSESGERCYRIAAK